MGVNPFEAVGSNLRPFLLAKQMHENVEEIHRLILGARGVMAMVRGTTPEYVLSVSGADMTGSTILVTIAQGAHNMTLSDERLTVTYNESTDSSIITFRLTQQETLELKAGKAQVQVKFADGNGYVEATDIGEIIVLPVLNEDVI